MPATTCTFNRGEHPVIVFDREGNLRRAKACSGAPTNHDRPGRHALAHRRPAPYRQAVHARGQAAADPGGPRQALDPPRRQALQPADARRAVSEERRHLRVGRVRKFARPQIRSQGASALLVGRAGYRPGLFQHPTQYRHRRRGPRVRRGPRESSGADLRRQRQVSDPAQQPLPSVRALLRPS